MIRGQGPWRVAGAAALEGAAGQCNYSLIILTKAPRLWECRRCCQANLPASRFNPAHHWVRAGVIRAAGSWGGEGRVFWGHHGAGIVMAALAPVWLPW